MVTFQIPDDAIKAVDVSYKAGVILVELDNGRIVNAPIEFLPMIRNNVPEKDLKQPNLIAGGTAVRFGNDEAVSIVSILGLDVGYSACKAWREHDANDRAFSLK